MRKAQRIPVQRARSIDVARMSKAAERPGVDPRIWFAKAIVTEIGIDTTEGNQGKYADVILVPDGTPDTVFLGSPYAGNQYGMHFPVNVGSRVVIMYGMGDPGDGGVIMGQWHSPTAPPNPELVGEDGEFTQNVVLRIAPGQQLIIRTSGAGDEVNIHVEGGGDVITTVQDGGQIKMGDGNVVAPLQGVVQGEGVDTFTGLTFAAEGNTSQIVAAKKQ